MKNSGGFSYVCTWEINFVDFPNHTNTPFVHSFLMRKRKADIVVYRGDDDEAADSTALHIPQARTILISDNGRRAITTPASPQKVSSGSHAPPAVYEWRPPSSEALDDPFLDVGEAAGSEKADGNVKAKVAAKRYPTSVRCFTIFLC